MDQNQVQVTPQPVSATPQNSSHLPLILGIALLCLIFLGIGWYLGRQSVQSTPVAISEVTVSKMPAATLSPTDSPKDLVESTESATVTVPSDWKDYNKKFGEATFKFKYPPNYEASDWDVDSGSISLSPHGVATPSITLDTFTHYHGADFKEYTEGSLKEWLLENYTERYSDQNFSTVQFSDVIINGVSYVRGTHFPASMFDGEMYFTAQNNISYFVINQLPDTDTLYKVLSTLTVTK